MEGFDFVGGMHSARHLRIDLTSREQQVMGLVEQGFSNKQIALDLGISPGTVKIHVRHIFEKTGVHGRDALALSRFHDRDQMLLFA